MHKKQNSFKYEFYLLMIIMILSCFKLIEQYGSNEKYKLKAINKMRILEEKISHDLSELKFPQVAGMIRGAQLQLLVIAE